MDAKGGSKPRARAGLHRFTDASIRGLPDGMHSDGGGLILQVEGNSRRWRFRYTRAGKTQYVTIGGYPDRKLSEARTKAAEYRNMLADKLDPKIEVERREAEQQQAERERTIQEQRAANTLESVARAYHAAHKHEWTPKHGAQWLASLENHVFPRLGARPVADIRPAELLDILLPLRTEMPETGIRVRERLDAIFADAVVRELCEQNPAAAIRKPLRQRNRVRKGHAAMAYSRVPAFIAELRKSDRLGTSTALAFEFLILSAARTSEVLEATWGEMDLERRLWTIPPERMKAKRQHTVHLTARMLAILRDVQTLRAVDPVTGQHRPTDVVFPSPQRATRPLSNMAFLKALERLGLWGTTAKEGQSVTAHGFRASFSTWANERGFPPDVIEAALAHGERDAVRAAYNRATYEKQRRRLTEAWGAFCDGRATAQPQAQSQPQAMQEAA